MQIQIYENKYITDYYIIYVCNIFSFYYSGYTRVPSRKMYWAGSDDCRNSLVFNSIRRDTFESVLTVLHFADNQKIEHRQILESEANI